MLLTSHTYIYTYVHFTIYESQVVTDIVDGDQPTHEEFMANLGTAAASLQVSLIKTVDFLADNGVAGL